jgi:hypothetical protein
MAGKYSAFLDGLRRAWRQRRRARNAAPRRAPAASTLWMPLLAAAAVAGGGVLLAFHAGQLGAASGSTPASADQQRVARLFQPLLPGASFTIAAGAEPGARIVAQPSGALLISQGLRAAPPVRVDLCTQLSGDRIVPLRIGYRFADVERWQRRAEANGQALGLRNILLLSDASANAIPELELSGKAWIEAPLALRWRAKSTAVQWISDANGAAIEDGREGRSTLRRHGWLSWGAGALRIERRASTACPRAGELVLQMYLGAKDAPPSALVAAMSAQGRTAATLLQPGRYEVPAEAPAALEDQTLFNGLLAHGLIRTASSGLLEAAPPDLPAWRAVPASARVGTPDAWQGATLDDKGRKLLKRLYQQADGAYVREQIDTYNSERQLLAWRFANGDAPAVRSVVAEGANGPLAQAAAMPASSARLFDDLPQGWQPWTRVAQWPASQSGPVKLTIALPRAANGSESLRLLLIGEIDTRQQPVGATLRATPACTGRACPDSAAVQSIDLRPHPGARAISFMASPLNTVATARNADRRYRHLASTGGRPDWQPLAEQSSRRRATEGTPAQASRVLVHDRNGSLLWSSGTPTRQAQDAGLATMLGLNPEHTSGIAGMLARALTLDLPLQALSQRVLECVGMRHGPLGWRPMQRRPGRAGRPPRRHGDPRRGNGDILAAAGAGAGEVNAANWAEVRDFDRTSPARSPLRLPALQHDGGAHRSPGSTFKVVSALGLELAAQSDPQLDALLAGMPLPAINRLAQRARLRFPDDAASYPVPPRWRTSPTTATSSLDRRAQDGRLGLAQALTYSLNTWFAWSGELSDRSLFGRADGGAPTCRRSKPGALDRCGRSSPWRAASASNRRCGSTAACCRPISTGRPGTRCRPAAHIDPIHTRHELRQMAIGLRMQATPLQMALAAAAVGQGKVIAPRLLLTWTAADSAGRPLGVRLDRIRAGMKGVVDTGTAAGAFRGRRWPALRPGLYGKTGTAPTGPGEDDGHRLVHRLAGARQPARPDATGWRWRPSSATRKAPAASMPRRWWQEPAIRNMAGSRCANCWGSARCTCSVNAPACARRRNCWTGTWKRWQSP